MDAGDLLFSLPVLNKEDQEQEIFRASAIIKGYEKLNCDVINVGYHEFASGFDQLKELSRNTAIPFVSANILNSNDDQPVFMPYRIIERGGINFGIIGLTDLVSDTIAGIILEDFSISGNIYLSKIRKEVDISILLINSDRSTYKNFPEIFPEADLIFTSGSVFMTMPMMDQEEDGPFVFSSGREGRYISQVKINMVDDEESLINRSYYQAKIDYINKRLDRYRDKDPNIPFKKLYESQPEMLKIIESGKKDIERMEIELKKNTNSISFKNIAMDSSITDDFNMSQYVETILNRYDKLKME